MRGTRRRGHSYNLVAPAFPLCARVLIFVVAASWASPLEAQASRSPLGERGDGYDFHNALPSIPDDRVKGAGSAPSATTDIDESCLMSPLTGIHSATTGVASLNVPGRAR